MQFYDKSDLEEQCNISVDISVDNLEEEEATPFKCKWRHVDSPEVSLAEPVRSTFRRLNRQAQRAIDKFRREILKMSVFSTAQDFEQLSGYRQSMDTHIAEAQTYYDDHRSELREIEFSPQEVMLQELSSLEWKVRDAVRDSLCG